MATTNAERQRLYVQRLKERAAEPHSPARILAALAELQPLHFPAGTLEGFAQRLIAEGWRLLGVVNGVPFARRKVRPKAKAKGKASGKKAARPRVGRPARPARAR